jgi:hypothetical protein
MPPRFCPKKLNAYDASNNEGPFKYSICDRVALN